MIKSLFKKINVLTAVQLCIDCILLDVCGTQMGGKGNPLGAATELIYPKLQLTVDTNH